MKSHETMRRHEHHFRAMGTDVDAWLWRDNEQQAHSALLQVESYFAKVEARLSRFRPASELSQLNRSAGAPFVASPMLFDLVKSALAWREATGGIFDPTILRTLEAQGYDRDFREIALAGGAIPKAFLASREHAEVRLGPGLMITLPAACGIDLGGIAKGWAARSAAQRLAMWGPALIDAGGDIAAVGAPPQGPWVVTVAHPLEADKEIAVLSLHDEAMATSSRVGRRWSKAGRAAHHLIDPRTGAPADTAILSVTVLGKRLPDVEIHAKVALILGEDAGVDYLNRQQGLSALITTEDGGQIMTGDFEERAYVSTSRFADRFSAA